MHNPNGSDIRGARNLLTEIMRGEHGFVPARAREVIVQALDKMWRAEPLRRGNNQQDTEITDEMKRQVFRLAKNLDLSNSDIAVAIGLPPCSGGRVSEILQGLR